ncbi:hypothetical protein Tco_0574290 [Tanacetum coccineum]
MGEALFLNRSRDLEFKDYIELNDLNELLELRNHENEDLGPTIEEGDIINELNGEIVETRDDNVMVDKIDEYPSICDYDRKIKDNCANNLKFSCMIGFCSSKEVKFKARSYCDRVIEMDPNTSIGQLCLEENNQGSVAEEEEGEHYFTPCYVGRLHAYNGEINLKYEKNLISNEFAVKLCLEYEEKNGEKLVKRELLVSLKGEFYFVKFIVNPEEDDVEPNLILSRLFMRIAKGIADFGNEVITIHPELNPFLDNSKETEKFEDDWDHLLDIDFGDIPEINEAGPSLSNGKPLTQEEAAREALTIDICKRFSLLEEERPVIKTMEYSDKYKKILDGIVMDKIKLDGEIKKEEE